MLLCLKVVALCPNVTKNGLSIQSGSKQWSSGNLTKARTSSRKQCSLAPFTSWATTCLNSHLASSTCLLPAVILYLPWPRCAAGAGWWRSVPAGKPARPRPPVFSVAPRGPWSECRDGPPQCVPSLPPGCGSTAALHTPCTPAAGWADRSPWGSGSSTHCPRRDLHRRYCSRSQGTEAQIHLKRVERESFVPMSHSNMYSLDSKRH